MEQENIATEYLEHNKALEQSPDYQKIIQDMDNEVYRQFALERVHMGSGMLCNME